MSNCKSSSISVLPAIASNLHGHPIIRLPTCNFLLKFSQASNYYEVASVRFWFKGQGNSSYLIKTEASIPEEDKLNWVINLNLVLCVVKTIGPKFLSTY